MYGALIGAGVGLLQTAISAGKAKNMEKPQGFSVSPEARIFHKMALERAGEGHSPEEKAYFEQLLARGGTATRRTLQNVGLAGVGSAAANIMGIDAMNKFASDGANIRRQNFSILGQAVGDIQSVQNMQSQQELSQYNTESQALGGGIQAGIGNIIGGLQSIDNEQMINKAIKTYSQGGLGSGGTSNASLVGGNGGNAGLGGNGVGLLEQANNPYSINKPFQGSGMGMFGAPAPNYGYNPYSINGSFQGSGMGMFGAPAPNYGYNPYSINGSFQGRGMFGSTFR